MTASTPLEKAVLLRLFKDFSADFNANSLSKILGRTRAGTLKALKSLEKEGILVKKAYGKAFFFKVNNEPYARKQVELLLMEEARSQKRWLEEFQGLAEHTHILVLFGSILTSRDPKDIDLLLVYEKARYKKVDEWITEKNRILPKKIHPIQQTMEDLRKNLVNNDKVILSAIREGIVLHGQEKIVEMINNGSG